MQMLFCREKEENELILFVLTSILGRFQQKLKSEGLYNLLLAYEDKSAVAVCTLAFCPYPHADPVLFTGV
jgi:hypothetical protein